MGRLRDVAIEGQSRLRGLGRLESSFPTDAPLFTECHTRQGPDSKSRRHNVRNSTLRLRLTGLLEKARECVVIEKVFRFDWLNLVGNRMNNVR